MSIWVVAPAMLLANSFVGASTAHAIFGFGSKSPKPATRVAAKNSDLEFKAELVGALSAAGRIDEQEGGGLRHQARVGVLRRAELARVLERHRVLDRPLGRKVLQTNRRLIDAVNQAHRNGGHWITQDARIAKIAVDYDLVGDAGVLDGVAGILEKASLAEQKHGLKRAQEVFDALRAELNHELNLAVLDILAFRESTPGSGYETAHSIRAEEIDRHSSPLKRINDWLGLSSQGSGQTDAQRWRLDFLTNLQMLRKLKPQLNEARVPDLLQVQTDLDAAQELALTVFLAEAQYRHGLGPKPAELALLAEEGLPIEAPLAEGPSGKVSGLIRKLRTSITETQVIDSANLWLGLSGRQERSDTAQMEERQGRRAFLQQLEEARVATKSVSKLPPLDAPIKDYATALEIVAAVHEIKPLYDARRADHTGDNAELAWLDLGLRRPIGQEGGTEAFQLIRGLLNSVDRAEFMTRANAWLEAHGDRTVLLQQIQGKRMNQFGMNESDWEIPRLTGTIRDFNLLKATVIATSRALKMREETLQEIREGDDTAKQIMASVYADYEARQLFYRAMKSKGFDLKVTEQAPE
jgi:hypothetical protein